MIFGRTNNVVFFFFSMPIVFIVPQTKDMLTSVFDPSARKSLFDILTLSVMALQIILFLFLPTSTSRWLFLGLFIFFRLAYNFGLGLLLKMQSDKKALVNWVKRKKLFKKEGSELSEFFKRELSVKMGDDYHFEVSWLGFIFGKKGGWANL